MNVKEMNKSETVSMKRRSIKEERNEEKKVVVELTSKRFKLAKALGTILILYVVFVFFGQQKFLFLEQFALATGIFFLLYGKIGAWWYHG